MTHLLNGHAALLDFFIGDATISKKAFNFAFFLSLTKYRDNGFLLNVSMPQLIYMQLFSF